MARRLFLFLVLLLAGCGGLQETLTKAIVKPLTKPIFGLAVEDAKTTLAWVEAQVVAGGISAQDAELARSCPNAVLEIATVRDKLLNPPDIPGFKGLIYDATVARFGTPSGIAQAKAAAVKVLAACMELAPSQILLGL